MCFLLALYFLIGLELKVDCWFLEVMVEILL